MGAESEGYKQRGRRRRGSIRGVDAQGADCSPPPPLPQAEFIDLVFPKKAFFRENCVFKFGHRTVNCDHKIFDKNVPQCHGGSSWSNAGLPWQWRGMLELEPCRYSLERNTLSVEPWRFTLEDEKLSPEPWRFDQKP
jgi:hypothetical protein